MDIRLPSHLAISAHNFRTVAVPLALRPGERLAAEVVARTASGQFVLDLGGRRVLAETQLPLMIGERLQLLVAATLPKPQLKLVAASNPALVTALALRHALPRQVPLTEALQAFKTISAQENLPSLVRNSLQALLTSLPERSALTQVDTLQAAVRTSGLFAEALTKASLQNIEPLPPHDHPQPDLKTRLLALAASLEIAQTSTSAAPQTASAPNRTAVHTQEAGLVTTESIAENTDPVPRLAEKTNAALARIILQQLASLPKPEEQTLTWHVEIPFRDGEHLQSLNLTITGERQSQSRSDMSWPWTVDLEIAPPALGRLRVKLVLQGTKISSYFWTETKATLHLLEDQIAALADRFHAVGLEPEHIQAVGELEVGTKLASVTFGPLLDEKT
ncbi:MAG: flagellar hook-length control protein FliK [Methylohalobius sp.]|nr:flagellar hook-length control protein FliK [Methylohalobius sp.]